MHGDGHHQPEDTPAQRPAATIALLLAATLLTAAIPTIASTGNQESCDLHEPIRILEDKGANGFVWDDPTTGEEVYRPGSGVVAGDGSASNPYVIEGWCISGADWDPPGIALSSCDFGYDGPDAESTGVIVCGTTAHFVLRNTTVSLWEHGTAVGNISPGTGAIEHTSHQNNTYQVHAHNASGLEIRENTIHGVDTTEMLLVSETAIQGASPHVTVEDNTLTGADTLISLDGNGLRLADNRLDSSATFHLDTRGLNQEIVDNTLETTIFDNPPLYALYTGGDDKLIENNTVDGFQHGGIVATSGTDVEIAHNHVTSTSDGTGVSITAETTLVHNTTVEGGSTGVGTGGGTNGVVVENVTVDGAAIGLDAYKGNDTTWQYNDLNNYTDAGMHVDQAENVTVRHTNFEDTNGTGLGVENTDTIVDARHNWWGCADGPDDAGCDDVVGDVVYEPWFTTPVSDAGAG